MRLLLVLATLVLGCSDPADGADAPPSTADAPAGTADATPGTPDAMVSTPDGAVSSVDAGPNVTIQMACDRACARIFECFMEPPDPACATECAGDLADCTQAEVGAVFNCGGAECAQLKTCIGTIACVDG
jgi:hypothetical protein